VGYVGAWCRAPVQGMCLARSSACASNPASSMGLERQRDASSLRGVTIRQFQGQRILAPWCTLTHDGGAMPLFTSPAVTLIAHSPCCLQSSLCRQSSFEAGAQTFGGGGSPGPVQYSRLRSPRAVHWVIEHLPCARHDALRLQSSSDPTMQVLASAALGHGVHLPSSAHSGALAQSLFESAAESVTGSRVHAASVTSIHTPRLVPLIAVTVSRPEPDQQRLVFEVPRDLAGALPGRLRLFALARIGEQIQGHRAQSQ
jgi:hypothetical protein